jgi:hypothetical protein
MRAAVRTRVNVAEPRSLRKPLYRSDEFNVDLPRPARVPAPLRPRRDNPCKGEEARLAVRKNAPGAYGPIDDAIVGA